jgi:type I restriction enzyme S subunit
MQGDAILPSGWSWAAVGDLAAPLPNAIVDGPFGSNLKVSDYREHGVPVLQGSNVTGDRFNLSDLRFVSLAKARELSRSLARSGDILVVKIGSVGYSAVIDSLGGHDTAVIPANLLKATLDQRVVSTKFVSKWLTSQQGRRNLVDAASSTAQPALTLGRFKALRVPLPPLREQHGIAEVLDTLDTTIRQTEAIIEKLKQVKQGLLHDLLTRGIDPNGELRPPQSQAPHLYKDSLLGWIPKEWEAKALNELVDQRRPIVYGILMPGQGHEGGVPVVKVKDIVGGSILLDQLLLTSPAIDLEYKRSRLKPGDLLFTIRGSVGRTAFVPAELEDANITQDTARIGIAGVDARFVREYLAMPLPVRFIATHTLGVAVQGINLRDVRRIPIAVPRPDEATEIADRLDSTNDRVTAEALEVQKLALTKAGLMDDLLTGRVRVTPLLA